MRADGLPGTVVASIAALVSGLSVFVNSYAVHAIAEPAVYTTAKNLVAAVILGTVALTWARSRAVRYRDGSVGSTTAAIRALRPGQWIGLAYVGIVGGGLAFVLFFNGLARTKAAPAAFWKDTLVVWVAIMAVPLLKERLAWWNLAAIGLLLTGQILVTGGVGHLSGDPAGLLVLSSSVLWALEVVVVKTLLRGLGPTSVATVRMTVGAVTLVVYLLAAGAFHGLLALDAHQIAWVLPTGVLLAAYVTAWMAALARGRAVDVTSILVGSAIVTWLLQFAAGAASASTDVVGLVLIGIGVTGAAGASWSAARTGRSPRPT